MIDELQAAKQKLAAAERVRQDRIDQEAQEKNNIVEAERLLKIAQQQKSESDWNTAIIENAALHAANQQAVADFCAELDNALARFKELLPGLNDTAVHTTADEMQSHALVAVGNRQRQAMIDYQRTHPDQDGKEAAAQVGFQAMGDVQVLKAPWTVENCLAAWGRDASDSKERRARQGIIFSLFGGELETENSDHAIQVQLDRSLHDRLSGGRA